MGALAVHHLGVAVEDLDRSIETYGRFFGASVEHRATVPDQGVEAASLKVGGSRVELLRPLAPDTPVGRFVARRGPGMHHVAFAVADLPAELARLRVEGAKLIDEEPRPGLFGLQVAFVHPEATGGVLAELVADERV
jgi:methylmalonyl-CoA epimerase